ncbi:MAG: acetylornithine deacetylase [Planctomycetota bacterium]
MVLTDEELLGRLVAFDSSSAKSNLPIADFACAYLERPGVAVSRHASPDGAKANVVAVAGPARADESGGGGGGGLVLCGHLDVVPAEEPGWRSDPFRLTEVDGTWVGRGACDMKGSIALAMSILAAVDVGRLVRPLALLLTYDEELGSLGAQHFAGTWPRDRALPPSVLVGEPTALRAVRMHKGHLTLRVTVQGKAAHTGSPHLGANAIEAAARVVQALSRLGDILRQKRCDSSPYFAAVPYPVLSISRINGGTAINVIPDRCVVDLGIRLLPGMNTPDAVEQVRDIVAKSEPHGNATVDVINNSPPLLTDENSRLHAALCDQLGQRQSCGVSFASDGGPLAERGFECVLFGPGSIDVAHRPNEFVPIDEFRRARSILEHLVERFCMAEGSR